MELAENLTGIMIKLREAQREREREAKRKRRLE